MSLVVVETRQVVETGSYIGMGLAQELFSHLQCLEVKVFCFLIESFGVVKDRQVVEAGSYIGMGLA